MFQQNKLLRFCVLSSLAIFLFAGVFAVRYYYFGSEKGDAPPSLKIGSALFKGQAVKGGLIEYSQEDKDNAAKADYSGKISVDVKKGTGYYFTEENMPLTDLLDAKKCMNPGVNRTLFFTYSPGGESGMGKAGFYIYPAGLASGDNSGITDPATFIVMKGRVFGLYSDNDVTAHCFKDATKISSISASNIFGGTTFIDGWIQFAANKNKLSEVLDPIKTCAVSSVWVQDGLDSFKKQVVANEIVNYIFDKYMLLWVKLKDCGKQVDQPAIKSITVTKKNAEADGVKIGWTDTKGGDVYKYLIYRSTSSPVDTSKGNYVPDGNLVGNITAPTKTFTDNKSLVPGTKYHYIIISSTGDNQKIETSDEFEVTTPVANEIVIIDPGVVLGGDIIWIVPEATEIEIIETEAAEYSSTTMGTNVTVTYKVTGSLSPEDEIYWIWGANPSAEAVASNTISTNTNQTINHFFPYTNVDTTYNILAGVKDADGLIKANIQTTVTIPTPINYTNVPCAVDEYDSSNDPGFVWANCHPRIKQFTDIIGNKCASDSGSLWCPGSSYPNNKYECIYGWGNTCNIYTP